MQLEQSLLYRARRRAITNAATPNPTSVSEAGSGIRERSLNVRSYINGRGGARVTLKMNVLDVGDIDPGVVLKSPVNT